MQWYSSLYTGLFRRFGPIVPRAHDPDFPLYSGAAAPWRSHEGEVEAGGIGWNVADAEAACVGEACERLQAQPLSCDRRIEACYEDWPLPEPAVDPLDWVLFHPEQYAQAGFPFEPFTRRTECSWVCCRQVGTGTPCWVPSEMAYLGLGAGSGRLRSRLVICPSVSTGLACGRFGDPVLLRGLQEVIERDAVVAAWWGRYSLEEYPMQEVHATLKPEWKHRLLRPNLSYRCFRANSPLSSHVTLVTIEGVDREGYCFSIGSACRETRVQSWEKAILEAVHGRHYVRYLKTQVKSGQMAIGKLPASFAEHAVYYSIYPEEWKKTVLANAMQKSGTAAGSDPAPEGMAVLQKRLGRPVLFRAMTPPALAQEGLDWYVLRVLVPGLQPLHGHHQFAHLGGSLWAPRGLKEWDQTPPHPFP